MSHYEGLRAEESKNVPAVVKPEQQKTLVEAYAEITKLNAEVQGLVMEIRDNQVLQEFAETVKSSGAMGAMGLLPKIPGILPELSPAFEALKKVVEVGQRQHELMGKLVEKIEGVNHA